MDRLQAGSLAIEADVLAARGGDQQAFTRLVETTCSLVSSIALAIVRDPDLSKDIAQDVFLSAWRDIGKLRDPASFLPWLRQVTRNRAYHILRGLRRGRRHTAESHADDLLEAAVDPRPDPHQRLVSIETRQLVADIIERLPVDAREVVTLYYREGRSTSQVADLLGLSEAAVRQRLARARASLREDLLEQAGREIAVTAPGAAFVAGVSTALTLGAPAASAAATVGMTGVKTSLFAKLALGIGAAGLGAAGGIAGIVLGLRPLRRQARDNEERTGLRRVQTVAIAVVIAFASAVLLHSTILSQGRMLAAGRWVAIGLIVVYYACLIVILEVWLPRIQRRRFEAEMREDPVAATERRRRDRIRKNIGWAVATALVVATIVALIVLWE
jgi:RNA polymerase sigma factor (sigma-70 family)